MKKVFLSAAFLVFLVNGISLADDINVGKFGGLNTFEHAYALDPADSQDLLNVDITPGGGSVKKRQGYGQYATLTSTQPIHGGYHFYDSLGNDVQVWGSSTTLWGSVGGAAYTKILTTATYNSTWQCVDSLGFAYCVNSNQDGLIKTNGSTFAGYTSPLGKLITISPDRLIIAGNGTNPNRLYFSQSGTFTNFTTASNTTDPFTLDIAAPGSKLTHIRYVFGKLFWWKDQSFGYVLGTDQYNVQRVIVSEFIGTLDNTSTYYDGILYFRNTDGHMYAFDGYNLKRLSIPITNQIKLSGHRSTNSWAQTSQADFDTGSYSNTTSTISAGNVVLQTNNVNIANSGFETNDFSSWTATSWAVLTTITLKNCGITAAYDGTSFAAQAPVVSGYSMNLALVDAVSSAPVSSITTLTYADNRCSPWLSSSISSATIGSIVRLKIYNTGAGSETLYSDPFISAGQPISFRYLSDCIDSGGTCNKKYFLVDFFQNGRSTITTGNYYSTVHNASGITSWGTFQATKTDNGGTHTFYTRASTNTFTVTSSTPTWIPQAIGSVVSASTGTYFQARDDFSIAVATVTSPSLSDFTFNWFEGNSTDQAYSIYFDNAIWWSVSYGAGQALNNYIFRYDLINSLWTLYNFGNNGMLVQNNNLYMASTSTGTIYKFGDTYSDNGAAIQSYWKSKTFTGLDPFLEQEFKNINAIAATNTGTTLTLTYTVNGSTTTSTNTISMPLTNSNDTIVRKKVNIAPGKIGAYFTFQFGDTSTSSSWEFFGIRGVLSVLPYKPS